MPLPKTQDVGKIVEFLKQEKPSMSKEQRIAIALSHAKKSGANMPDRNKVLDEAKKAIKSKR